MNVVIAYNEISEFINKKCKVCPELRAIDESTIEISYKPALLPPIAVRIHVDAVRKDIICVSYECGPAASMMFTAVIAYLQNNLPNGVDVNTSDKRVDIYPQRFKQLEKVLEYVSLSGVSFEESAVNVTLSMA
ncbi:MAG: hypothetical protein IJ280_06675 [Bacteroidales bacterium]|nr:hypothetical protein [Bacteroidales bacterium]